jgi:hypothetical protein
MCSIVGRLTNNMSSFSYTNAQGQFVTKNLCPVPTLLDYSKQPQLPAKDAPRPAVLERTEILVKDYPRSNLRRPAHPDTEGVDMNDYEPTQGAHWVCLVS